MQKYIIEGGHPLKGKVQVRGNKNAALPCIAACLLTDEEVTLTNVPMIEDVDVLLKILSAMGAEINRPAPNVVKVKAQSLKNGEVPAELAKKVRASILVAGPLLARMGRVILPPPGGDVIGRRRLDTHFLALTDLGARIETDGVFQFIANRLVGADIFLDEASVTATENAIMASVLAEGDTIIQNAACEPHVQDLCFLLNSMGAQIEGIGSNILRIKGVKKLHGTSFEIGPDYMEVGSFIGLAAVTHSSLEIQNAGVKNLRMIKLGFGKLGVHWEAQGDTLFVPATQSLKVQNDFGGAIPKIDDAPWPGFPADLTSIMVVTATQCHGTVLIHEKMFESRMFFVDKLISMGAGIILCDPHRAVVSGPTRLRGAELVSPDVRAGMAMVLAGLAADGKSTIQNVYQIERGYENIVSRLQELGAKIERVDSA
jgi:UDP-N-acetylglucosamine 1-carboxyvinyltransferase